MARTNSHGTEAWSYSAGKKRKNRVRAYEEKDGQHWLDWHVPMFDNKGNVVIDPRTQRQARRRVRLCITALGVTSRDEATEKAVEYSKKYQQLVAEAEAEAAELRRAALNGGADDSTTAEGGGGDGAEDGPLTLGRLLELYTREVTPTMRMSTQRAHGCFVRLHAAYFGRDAVVERVGVKGRIETDLNRVRYNEFCAARKAGTVPGYPTKVKSQTLGKDIAFLLAVFHWARIERSDGTYLLIRNPWEGFPLPDEDTPIRIEMTLPLHEALTAGAPNWRMREVMVLCRETRRRGASVRQLALEDVDLCAGTVVWRGEFDKARRTRVTPLSKVAREAIARVLERRKSEGVEGSPWLFPAVRDPQQPLSRNTLLYWMSKAKQRVGIKIPRLGLHGEKRAGIRNPRFRQLDPKVQEELAGTRWETMRLIYDYVDLPAMQDAVAFLEGDADSPHALPEARGGLRKAA